MRRNRGPSILAALLWIAAGGGVCGCRQPAAPPAGTLPGIPAPLASGGEDGFARAESPRRFEFPRDHGPHPEFRTEWWYFTGNLEDPAGRRFGFQLTFFRAALSPAPPPRSSSWASAQAYMAHFAVTDVRGRVFRSSERFARAALGLAGASARPFRVWLEDWEASGSPDGPPGLVLRASTPEASLDLALSRGKPPVFHGEGGVSRKGEEPGNASYYYSLTRMPARGTVRVGGAGFEVTGEAWMDREWGTSALPPGVSGWDWFALQLSDGRELMLYLLRGADGSPSPRSAGTVVEPDGSHRNLSRSDFRVETLARWRSPRQGVRYPSKWRIVVPSEGISLGVTPVLPDQEQTGSFRYWEGAVSAEGVSRSRAVDGRGYVEMTGYAPGNPRSRKSNPEGS